MQSAFASPSLIDSRYAAGRLLTTLALVTLGNGGMYVVAVVLPTVQAEFGVGHADASLPYTLMMVSLGLGGLLTGRMADRHGLMPVLWVGALLATMLALSLAPQVRVVGVAPGLTITSHLLSDDKFQKLHRLSPLGRSSTAADVVGAVRFALENRSITGTTLLVDGGQHLMKFDRDFSLM